MVCIVPITLSQTIDDGMLIEIVTQQSPSVYVNDTSSVGDSSMVVCDTIWEHYPHPLCMPLMYVPETLPPLYDTISHVEYTIANIRRNARR